MAIYRFRPGVSVDVDAQTAGESLERIREANGGALRPCDVVEDARPEDSPLHPAFEWDDSIAAEEHRRAQARRLISGLRIVTVTPEGPQRIQAFVSVASPELGRTYLPVETVMSDNDLRERALAEARAQLDAWRRRYSHLYELGGVFAAIEETLQAAS